ncbi:MAG: HAMP domain-containing histidine kinase [Saprospiraceae bacterium]|nr:HAMP domain-containing histidine kinase [Saprospiraceae bacterium]
MQIRTRLTLLFLLLAAGILAAVLSAVYWMFKKNTEESFYQGLINQTEVAAQTILLDANKLHPMPSNWIAPDDDINNLPYQENLSIFDQSYQRVFSTNPNAVPIPARDLETIYKHGEERFIHFNLHAYGRTVSAPDSRPYVIVTEGYCNPTVILELRNILIFSFLIGVFLVAVSGWYYAGRALDPVTSILHEVEKIQPSDLSKRVETIKNKDEIGRLAITFNLLLERVERAFLMQKMFISNVSHELNNPLTAIRSQIDVLLQRDRSQEQYKVALNSVLDDLKSLNNMEQQLMDLARVYTTPHSIPRSPTRLDELLWQASDQHKKRNPEYPITIEILKLPEQEEDLIIHANETLLKLALLNLMNNACKYSPDNSAQIKASFEKGRHQIEICDKGDGIPEEERHLIFEPFYRSPRHLQVKGTGIGLSLVKSILNLHEIDISVESPPSGGTIFRLIFPE